MTPIQWGPSPPEPESYSATSTGTPAPLSPDVAELVRRVRQVDYAEDAGGYLLKDEVNQLADACERLSELEQRYAEQFLNMQDDLDRLAAENAKLRAAASSVLSCYDAENGFASWGTTPEAWGEATEELRAALKETA